MAGTTQLTKAETLQEIQKRKEARKSGSYAAPEIKHLQTLAAINSIQNVELQSMAMDAVTKAVESYDITGSRFVSYFDQVQELATDEFIFSNIAEANGIARSTDFQIRWREIYANEAAVCEFFNLNAGLPNEAEMTRAVFGNTMGAYGNLLNIRWIAQELAAQSPIADGPLGNEKETQLRMQLIRMKHFRNEKFMVNNEVKSEIVGDTPQWRGFYTDSTLNRTVLAGGAQDLTEALIDSAIASIVNYGSVESLGSKALVALTTRAQIGVIKDLMIARYTNAESSQGYLANQERLKRMLPNVNIDPDRVAFYEPRTTGKPVMFIYEPQFSDGVTLMFDPTQPRICKFQMMNQFGPWVLSRVTPEFTDLLAVIDFESIATFLRSRRASFSNCN